MRSPITITPAENGYVVSYKRDYCLDTKQRVFESTQSMLQFVFDEFVQNFGKSRTVVMLEVRDAD